MNSSAKYKFLAYIFICFAVFVNVFAQDIDGDGDDGSGSSNGEVDGGDDYTNGELLFIGYPSCGFWQCHVNWTNGETQNVSWLNPTRENITISLIPAIQTNDDGSVTNTSIIPTYNLTNDPIQASVMNYSFTVNAQPGNYSVRIIATDAPSIQGYSDIVTISGEYSEDGPEDGPDATHSSGGGITLPSTKPDSGADGEDADADADDDDDGSAISLLSKGDTLTAIFGISLSACVLGIVHLA